MRPDSIVMTAPALDDDLRLERAASWRSEGWTGYAGPDYRPSSTGSSAGQSSVPSGLGTAGVKGIGSAQGRTSGTGAIAGTPPGSTRGEREDVIPVAEEELRVRKREVSGGRVRVRSYLVETPVQEQVNLRQEHVSIERRPVDRIRLPPVTISSGSEQSRRRKALRRPLWPRRRASKKNSC